MSDWKTECRNTERFHKEKLKQHGKHSKVIGGSRGENKGWSVRKTAIALKISIGKCSEDLNLAQGLRDYESLKNFIHRADAILFLRVKKQG